MKAPSSALVSPTQEKTYSTDSTGRGRRVGKRIPGYRHHKGSGQAVVTLNGKDCYLGVFGTAASHQKYARLLAEWEVNNRRVPIDRQGPEPTIAIIMDAFWGYATTYYYSCAYLSGALARWW